MPYNRFLKRAIDILISTGALLLLSPLFYFIIIIIRLESPGPAFFKQKRIGKDLIPFNLIKFRSMANKFGAMLGEFEPGCINRITKTGFFIRKTKLDELPELFNVLKGDMSLVGPRPEVERYVQIYQEDFKEVLKIRPGLSDFASIKYRDEEDILSKQRDPEQYYCHVILPDKLQLAKYYVEKMSLKKDLAIIGRTLMRVVGGSLEK